MSALDNGMSMMDVATFWQYIVKGAILLLGSMDGFGDEAQNIKPAKGKNARIYALPPDLRIRRLSLFGH